MGTKDGLDVSKKVNLLGSWNEDVFTDDIIRTIAARSRSEKGKKVKIHLNEAGIKLTQFRFFQENKSTFFPLTDLRHVTRSPESPLCVLFILSNPDKKYKILALRCYSDSDSNKLVNTFSNIQRKGHSVDLELRKRENGNWTLREKTYFKSYRTVTDVFSDLKPNGEVAAATNGYATAKDSNNNQGRVSEKKGLYVKRDSGRSNRSRKKKIAQDREKDTNDFVITTEVMEHPHQATEIHIRNSSDDLRKSRNKVEYTSLNDQRDGSRRQEHATRQSESEHNALPLKTINIRDEPYVSAGKGIVSSYAMGEPKKHEVVHTKSAPPSRTVIYTSIEPGATRVVEKSLTPSQNVVYTVPEPTRYRMSSGRSGSPSHNVVYTVPESSRYHMSSGKSPPSSPEYAAPEPTRYHTSSRRSPSSSSNIVYAVPEPARYQISSGRNVLPSRAIVYSTSARSSIPTTPVIVREPPRIYEARIDSPSAYYTNPWAAVHGRAPELVPVRVLGKAYKIKVDQRSLRSNTSKTSKSSNKASSEFHYPTTLARAVEDTYRHPNFRPYQNPNYFLGYVPRPVTFHTAGAREFQI